MIYNVMIITILSTFFMIYDDAIIITILSKSDACDAIKITILML